MAHGGIDTAAVGVTRRGRALLLTLGDAVLVAPAASATRNGFCRPRGAGSGAGGGQDAVGLSKQYSPRYLLSSTFALDPRFLEQELYTNIWYSIVFDR